MARWSANEARPLDQPDALDASDAPDAPDASHPPVPAMSCLLQVSDPHFGTEQAPVVAALERLAHALAPDAVIFSGDLTQRARPAEFAAARRFADRLGAPRLLAIPGNHDLPLYNLTARVMAPYAGFRRAFGPELEPSLDTPRWLVIALNTTRPWRHKNGEVSTAQIEAVVRRLKTAAPAQLRVVVVHQPVAVSDVHDAHDLLRGHGAAVRRWAEAGADLIVGGHIHLPFVLPLHDAAARPATVGSEPLRRRLWAVQAGTAVSTRLRYQAGNSVNVIRREAQSGPTCTVERWDYSSVEGEFLRFSHRVLQLGPLDDAERSA